MAMLQFLFYKLDSLVKETIIYSPAPFAITGGSVGIISTARDDWTPLANSSVATENEVPEISIKSKGQRKVDTLDSFQQSQADWIRQYMEQQEEVLNQGAIENWPNICIITSGPFVMHNIKQFTSLLPLSVLI